MNISARTLTRPMRAAKRVQSAPRPSGAAEQPTNGGSGDAQSFTVRRGGEQVRNNTALFHQKRRPSIGGSCANWLFLNLRDGANRVNYTARHNQRRRIAIKVRDDWTLSITHAHCVKILQFTANFLQPKNFITKIIALKQSIIPLLLFHLRGAFWFK